MDPKSLKKIVEIMNQNDLAEVEIEEEGLRLRLRKMEGPAPVAPAPAPVVVPATPAATPNPTIHAEEPAAEAAVAEGLHTITAPMVGTFYRAPAPDAEPYIEVAQRITPETVVCILEAMKVMNEIKAECSGEIVKVCAQNGEAVEYDQPLFTVKTS
ncbi:MAG: acetyl-CoA carboxylase biotin carboxyl carrier protein [Planctomycetota bacterium]|jgi:acetyl-CoA carboxylase biotin carboxyl carrier protein